MGSTESDLSRAEVERNEVSWTVGVSFPNCDALLSIFDSCLNFALYKEDRPKSSCSRDGKGNMGGSAARGGIGERVVNGDLCSSGLAVKVDDRALGDLRGELICWFMWWKSEVESTLTRLENRFLAFGVVLDARLDVVDMDQRLRFRKPSLKPPRLLDLEWVLEDTRRRLFLGETMSSSRSFTGSSGVEETSEGSFSI